MRALGLAAALALAACQPAAEAEPAEAEESLAVPGEVVIAEMEAAMVVAFGDIVAAEEGQALRTTELLKGPLNARLAQDLPLGDGHAEHVGSTGLAIYGDDMDLVRLVVSDSAMVQVYRDAFPKE